MASCSLPLGRSMADRDLAPLIAAYGHSEALPPLPVETNGALRALYIAYFRDANQPALDTVLDAHAAFHVKVPPPGGTEHRQLRGTIVLHRKMHLIL